MLDSDVRDVLRTLYNCGAIGIDTKKGFELKVHRTDPNQPLSPIYFNLRTADNPKPGPLTWDIVSKIGKLLFEKSESLTGNKYDSICGIPNAGTPFAQAFAQYFYHKYGKFPPIIQLKKLPNDCGMQVVGGTKSKSRRSILIDDVISKALSKLEATAALEEVGDIVSYILVFLDRQKKEANILRNHNYLVSSVVSVEDALVFYRDETIISSSDVDRVLGYLQIEGCAS